MNFRFIFIHFYILIDLEFKLIIITKFSIIMMKIKTNLKYRFNLKNHFEMMIFINDIICETLHLLYLMKALHRIMV